MNEGNESSEVGATGLDRFLPVVSLPGRLGVSLRSVWRLLEDGTLHPVRVRRRVLVAESEVRAYMDRQKQGGNGAAEVAQHVEAT